MKYKNFIYILASLFLISSCDLAKKFPDNTAIIEPKKELEVMKNTVNFEFDKYSLTYDAKKILDDEITPWLEQNQVLKVVIEGHCDERGSQSYNKKLGLNRAKSVKEYLVKKGIDASRIKVVSYGKTKPIDLGHNEDAWAKNRRGVVVEIKK